MTSDVKTRKTAAPVNAGEEDVNQYLRDIRQIPRLSPEEELQLAILCAQGDEQAIHKMVNANLRLVVSVAMKYSGRGASLSDLIQEGSIGLIHAARAFDHTRNNSFSTYAYTLIEHEIIDSLMDNGVISLTDYRKQQIRRIKAARARLTKELGAEPTAEQISAACDIPAKTVSQLLQVDQSPVSLDAPRSPEEEGSLSAQMEDDHASEPYEELVREELNRTIEDLLAMLTQRQQQVLRLRFGMVDGICYSLAEIGKKLDISKERARQLEDQGKSKLQILGKKIGLEDFLV